jgi:hypothetical protein
MNKTNTNNHDFEWLLNDAITMYQLNRKRSAILLLLCAVDALARRSDPDNKKVGERFENFLKSKMRREGRTQIHNIQVPKENKLFTFECLIYKFLRNPFIHEGTKLENQNDYAVCIDWNEIPHGIKVDSKNNKVILGGELVYNILTDAVKDEIKINI